MKISRPLVTFALASTLCANAANAADVNLADYTALPAGTTLAVWYQQYGHFRSYRADNGHRISDQTGFRTNITMFRIMHYMEIGGFTMNPQILLPMGNLYHARIAGQSIPTNSGIGDPAVGGSLWLINQPEAGHSGRYLGISPLIFIPVGDHDENAAINIGENRWRFDLQIGWIEPLWGKASMEIAAGVITYGDNDEAGNGHQTLRQDETYSIQANLRYDLNDANRLGIGYGGYFGGNQEIDGIDTGTRTEWGQLRLEYQRMLLPGMQLSTQVTHDVHSKGGFRKDYGINLRLLYIF